MKAIKSRIPALALSCIVLNSACNTPEGAQAMASFLPRVNVHGPGFGNRSFGIPAETFMSQRLKFQTAVIKDDVSSASRNIKSEWIEVPIKGQPPIFYAAANGSSPMIRLLVKNGASVRQRFRGNSLAYLAASYGHAGAATELVEIGGGSSSDLFRGRALYVENQAIQRKQAQVLLAGALVFLEAAATSSSDSNTDEDYENAKIAIYEKQHGR